MTYTTEQEQIEQLKRFWQEYGKSLMVGLALGIGAVLAWRAWTGYQRSQAEQASLAFQRLLRAQGTEALSQGAQLMEAYGSTPYGFFSALLMARWEAQGQRRDAERHLAWAEAHAPHDLLAPIPRLRLARLKLEEGHPREALALLGAYPQAFAPLALEIEGDARAALGERDKAREAYRKAMEKAEGATLKRLEMKLDDLG